MAQPTVCDADHPTLFAPPELRRSHPAPELAFAYLIVVQ
jgi:hypothetical protein